MVEQHRFSKEVCLKQLFFFKVLKLLNYTPIIFKIFLKREICFLVLHFRKSPFFPFSHWHITTITTSTKLHVILFSLVSYYVKVLLWESWWVHLQQNTQESEYWSAGSFLKLQFPFCTNPIYTTLSVSFSVWSVFTLSFAWWSVCMNRKQVLTEVSLCWGITCYCLSEEKVNI